MKCAHQIAEDACKKAKGAGASKEDIEMCTKDAMPKDDGGCPFGEGSPFQSCCGKGEEEGMKCAHQIAEDACKKAKGAAASKEDIEMCTKDAMPKEDGGCPFEDGSPFQSCCGKGEEEGMKCAHQIAEDACKKAKGAGASKEDIEMCTKDAMPNGDGGNTRGNGNGDGDGGGQ